MNDRREGASAAHARRVAEQASSAAIALTPAQRAALTPELLAQLAAVTEAAKIATAPGVEAVRQAGLAYLAYTEMHRAQIDNLTRGVTRIAQTIAEQIRDNPELVAAAVRAAKAHGNATRPHDATVGLEGDDLAIEDAEVVQVAEGFAEADGFGELINDTRERVAAGEIEIAEDMYGLGLEAEELYVFISVYLALTIGLVLYEHPNLALAVEKSMDLFTYAFAIYSALAKIGGRRE